MELTDYHAKYFAHELSKRHSVADSEKLAGTLLDAQVDLNPHQLDAALFAFKSPLSKGAILADEVGLGKTIEAGLLLSQKWAEGKRRIMIICPASLRKQWSQELEDKFFLPSLLIEAKNYNKMVKDGAINPFDQKSIVICSYQFAARHYEELMVYRWDLVVMDEAHRLRNVYRTDNKIGKALKTAFENVPKILLTATPLQNSLMELYGLVSIIDDYAFGDAKSFRAQYSRLSGDDLFNELKARLKPLCQRTLRRQVLEYIRYTNRIPITQEFIPSEDEQALYEMVSEYLRKPSLKALPSGQRSLMTLIMRKLLASSSFAIAGTLDSLARKLESQLKQDAQAKAKFEEELEEDFEELDEIAEEWGEYDDKPDLLTQEDIATIQAEIEELKQFRDLATSIEENAKGDALLKALKAGFAKTKELGGLEKAIIFTESRRTQNYLLKLLNENGYSGKFILFNGSNNDDIAKGIYKNWLEANKTSDKITGLRSADMRTALVECFKNEAQIMIATEAAAEGINLQFCSMLVNYDLPWNPQRIEQRIGRCHRYGQKHDVVVINFLNRKNAADLRVYELLEEKFQLFSGVFGASDEVLGAIESGVDFEKRIMSIYQNCRTEQEISQEFTQLRLELDEQITATMQDTRQKLLENFDAEVHDRLKISLEESKIYINKYEQMLWSLTQHELEDNASFDRQELNFFLNTRPEGCPEVPDGPYHLGREFGNAHRYRLNHPLGQFVISKARDRGIPVSNLTFQYLQTPKKAAVLEPLLGKTGWLRMDKLSIEGADAQDHILMAGMTNTGEKLTEDQIRRLFNYSAQISPPDSLDSDKNLVSILKRRKKEILDKLAAQQAEWFDDEIKKLDGWADDKRKNLKIDLKELDDQIKELKREARLASNLPEKLPIQKKIRTFETRRDEAWRQYDEAARDVEKQKDELLDKIEAQLAQQVVEQEIMTVQWRIS